MFQLTPGVVQNNNKQKKGKTMKVKIRGLVFAGFAAAVFAQSAMAVDTDDKTVTSKTYVDAKFQAQAKRVEIGNGTGQYASVSAIPETVKTNEYYPSMKVLSDTVLDGNFQRKLTESEKGPHVGIMINNGTEQAPDWQSEWQEIGGSTYVSVGSNTGGTAISVGLNDGKIANTATVIAGNDGQGPATGDEDDLTTAQAVYDFVVGDTTGGFQPKTHVDSTNGEVNNSLKFGMGEGKWGVVRAYGQTSPNQTANSYLQIVSESERDTYSIGIDPSKVASHGASGGSGNNVYSNQILSGSASLATANAVYEYAVKQQWDAQNDVGKHLVIDSNGVVALSTEVNPDIPVPTDSRCVGENSTHVCALVAYYDANAGGTGVGGVKYEWTVMAPTE